MDSGNYNFRTKKLVQLWEAEGMQQRRGDKTEDEVGEQFLVELIERGLIQITTKTSTSDIKTCLTHELIQKFGESKAPEFSSTTISRSPQTISDFSQVCLLVLYNTSIDSFSSRPSSSARTLLRFDRLLREMEPLPGSTYGIGKPKQLRVLDVEGARISNLTEEIGQPIHLRYLGLRRTLVRGLPQSARKLMNLQTLHVKYTHINQIPEAIEGMRRLRHLLVSRAIEVGNSELIEPLKDLRTISMMHADGWMEKGLSTMVSLRKFGINGDLSFCSNSLNGSRKLESLRVGLNFGNTTLDWKSLPRTLVKLHLKCRIEKLPPANECLVKLCLRWSLLEEDQFTILQSFQKLKVRLLGRGSFVGKKMVFSAAGFSSFEVLRLDQLNDLEELSVKVWVRMDKF